MNGSTGQTPYLGVGVDVVGADGLGDGSALGDGAWVVMVGSGLGDGGGYGPGVRGRGDDGFRG